MRFLLPFFLFGQLLTAQNLVVNPGFEKSESDHSGILGFAQVDGWRMPSYGTSDYILVPEDSKARKQQIQPTFGYIIPFEGNACAGFLTVAGGYEYLSGTLTEPLQADSSYTISFAIATLTNAYYKPERIGIYFSEEEDPHYHQNGMPRIPWKPQVTLREATAGEQDGNWQVYTLTYAAKGGEISFVIGDFTDTFEKNGRRNTEACYFFVDSVVIRPRNEFSGEDSSALNAVTVDTLASETLPEIAEADSEIVAGTTLTLENIYFETNKSRILPESYKPLYDIIIALKMQPALKVEIVGHTDKHGDAKANQKLSEERAKAVAEFFIAKGIDPARITTRGCGSSQPVGNDDQKNRRVEFIFTE